MWGAAQPKDLPQARLRLDFGLRPAILVFNDWAVPGLSGASFVRQLSWACMGLRLAQEVKSDATPARIAEGLEALASWMVVKGLPEGVLERRVQGRRKFAGRRTLSFGDVARRSAYVTVPFRRSTTRALPGLGLCVREEARFGALELSAAGAELAEHALAAGTDGQALRALVAWIEQSDTPITKVSAGIRAALDPRIASEREKRLVRTQLLSERRRAEVAGLMEQQRAEDLVSAEGRLKFLSQLQDRAHAARLQTCFAFEDIRGSALQAAQVLGEAVADAERTPAALAARDGVAMAFGVLAKHCAVLLDGLDGAAPAEAGAFCQSQGEAQPLDTRIASLVQRVPLLFSLVDGRIERCQGYTGKPLVADDAFAAQENDEPAVRGLPRPLLRLRNLLEDLR